MKGKYNDPNKIKHRGPRLIWAALSAKAMLSHKKQLIINFLASIIILCII